MLPFLNGFSADDPVVRHAGEAVSRTAFVAGVAAFRQRLPAVRYVVNLCESRHGFASVLAATLANDQITLLPPDAREATLSALCRRYESVAVVADAVLPSMDVPVCRWTPGETAPADESGLHFSEDHVAAIVHTSGSTGEPQPHARTWGALVRHARSVGARLNEHLTHIDKVVATVPSQHMYGLENAIMLPLQHGLAMHAARPFFPADVAAALCDDVALLVTTPIHLKSLVAAEAGSARLVLSSTAPLADDLARRAESALHSPVIEIYGSTETGVIATRRTAAGDAWQLLDGLRLRPGREGMLLEDADAGTVIELHDTLELLDGGRFRLGPRNRDLVKVAGKRASLAALNAALLAVPGIEDGAFVAPPASPDQSGARLTAFVVAPDIAEADILAALRQSIDPVFLPRPLIKVESLPRNAVGKLPWDALQRLCERAPPLDRQAGCE
ncbi:MAG TPA: AMP-binding protein [Gammaproteobacteria bacterium]|nr:AMP-binding protein [Gammaproteobacteria bacterium]